MTVKQAIIERLDGLTPQGQSEVLQLIDDLQQKPDANNSYDALLQELLDKRLAHAKANPSESMSFEELEKQVTARYKWDNGV